MAVFTVSLVAYFVDKTLLNGAIGFLTLFSGGIGLALFLVIWMSRDNYDGANDDEPLDDPEAPAPEDGKADEPAEKSAEKQNNDTPDPQ